MSSWLPSFNQASEAFAKIGGELNELTSELTSKVGGELNELSTKVGDINFNELSSKVQGALPINIDNELINKLTLRSDELVREHELLDAQEKRKELVREYLSEILPWETKDESRSVLVEKCREEILKLSLEKGTFETPFLLERGIMFNPSETFDDDYEEEEYDDEEEEYDDEEEEVHFEHDNSIGGGNGNENENEDNKEANEAKDANDTTDTLDTIEIKDVQPQAQAQAQGSSDEPQPQQEAGAETETETKNGNKNKLEKDDGATNAAIIAASAAKLQKMQPLPLLLEHFDIDTHVGLIERLLKVDENLVHMHSMLSGAGEKESTFWRNYFFHCAYTRYENGLSIDEIWSSKPKAMITGVGVGVGAGGGGGGVGGTSEGNFTSSVGQRRSDPSLEDIVDDEYDEYNEYDEYDESSSVELEMEIKNATSDIMDDNTHHSHAHSVSISTVNSEYSVGGGDDAGTTTGTGTGSTTNHTTFSTTKTTTTMTTTTTTAGGATSAANANANSESSGSGTSYEMIGGEAVDVGLADVDDDGDMEDLDDLEAEIARELGEL